MRYDYRIDELESLGINYHRIIADWITEKLQKNNSTANLLVGETDLLITYLLSKAGFHLHLWGKFDEFHLARVFVVKENSFPFNEYDTVIGLFCDEQFVRRCISAGVNFILIPHYNAFGDKNATTTTRNLLKAAGCHFTTHRFTTAAYSRGYVAFTNI